jgi:hypothetical protein
MEVEVEIRREKEEIRRKVGLRKDLSFLDFVSGRQASGRKK